MDNDWTNPFNPLITEAADDPVTTAHKCRDELSLLERGYHLRLYALLAVAQAIAEALEGDFAQWKAFLGDPFWATTKRRPRPHKGLRKTLHWVMIFVWEARSEQTKDRVRKYARVVNYYRRRKGVSPQQLVEQIEGDDGFEAALRKARKEDPLRKSKASVNQNYFTRVGKSKANDIADTSVDILGETADHDLTLSVGASKENGRATLYVEMTPKELDRLLDLEKGRKAHITIRSMGTTDNWKRFRAVRVRRIKKPTD